MSQTTTGTNQLMTIARSRGGPVSLKACGATTSWSSCGLLGRCMDLVPLLREDQLERARLIGSSAPGYPLERIAQVLNSGI